MSISLKSNIDGISGAIQVNSTDILTVDATGDLTFNSLGARISGDFSNATHSNRTMFQTSTVNGSSVVGIIPNGTGSFGALNVYNSSDISTNYSQGQFGITTTALSITSTATGTGTVLPIVFNTSGAERLRIDASGNLLYGRNALPVFASSGAVFDGGNLWSIASSGGIASMLVAGGTDMTNAPYIRFRQDTSTSRIDAGITGTASYTPITFYTNGSERLRIDTTGNIGIGGATNTWSSSFKAIDFLNAAVFSNVAANTINLASNLYNDGALKCKNTGVSSNLNVGTGAITMTTYASAAAGSTPTVNSIFQIDNQGNAVLTTATGGLGYGTGAGGTVTQLTSKSTAVTLNKPTGTIVMNNAALSNNATVTFLLNNSLVTSNDVAIVNANNNSNYRVEVSYITTGVVGIRVTNMQLLPLSEALPINFAIIKGATS